MMRGSVGSTFNSSGVVTTGAGDAIEFATAAVADTDS
jgi:hypothetical protein